MPAGVKCRSISVCEKRSVRCRRRVEIERDHKLQRELVGGVRESHADASLEVDPSASIEHAPDLVHLLGGLSGLDDLLGIHAITYRRTISVN